MLCAVVGEQIRERIPACLVGEYDGPSEVLLNLIIRRRAGRVHGRHESRDLLAALLTLTMHLTLMLGS